MNQSTRFRVMPIVAVCIVMLALAGCFRKPITSDKPWRKPVSEEPSPVSGGAVSSASPSTASGQEEDSGIIEETFIVGDENSAQKSEAPLMESDLTQEEVPAPVVKEPAGATDQPAQTNAAGPVATQPQAGNIFIQVGAFEEMEKAERALARLVSDGYKGSRISESADGLFRVQAGAFADLDAARNAQDALLAEYPGSYIIKD